jgi:hypothetical protein
MTTMNDMHQRRHEIREMASVIQNLMTPEQLAIGPIAKVTHILLCDLCESMNDHLADEHKGVYPALLSHSEQKINNMAWGLINNDKLLKPEFGAYKKRWLKDCEFQFSDEFIRDTNEMLDSLNQRLDLEKNTILPRMQDQQVLAMA